MKKFNFFDLTSPVFDQVAFGSRRSYEKIAALGDFKDSDRVLDLGGGSGRIARFFVGKVQEVAVADSSRGMNAYCQKRQGLSCVLCNAEQLPFKDGSFDKVIIVDAFHHFGDPQAVAREVVRVLKAGGRLIIEEYNPKRFGGFLIRLVEKFLNMHSRFYAPKELQEFWVGEGFGVEVVDEGRVAYYLTGEKTR